MAAIYGPRASEAHTVHPEAGVFGVCHSQVCEVFRKSRTTRIEIQFSRIQAYGGAVVFAVYRTSIRNGIGSTLRSYCVIGSGKVAPWVV